MIYHRYETGDYLRLDLQIRGREMRAPQRCLLYQRRSLEHPVQAPSRKRNAEFINGLLKFEIVRNTGNNGQQRDLPAFYAVADVFVLPSEDEPWGLAINEAMACGVPVVTTHEVGAAADLVTDGETGYTYRTGDAAGLANVLEMVLTNGEKRSVLRDNCQQRMASWSYAETVRGIEDALRSAPPRLS